MEKSLNNISDFIDEDKVDIKREVKRYWNYWPWFIIALLVALFTAYSYLRYAPRIFQTTSKVKILDESEGLELPSSAFIFNRSNINLENEVEILTSYIILEKVVLELMLNTNVFIEGNIRTTQIAELPFTYIQRIQPDSIFETMEYTIDVESEGFKVFNDKTEEIFDFPGHNSLGSGHKLPFEISIQSEQILSEFKGIRYKLFLSPIKSAVLSLKNSLEVNAIGEQSDLLGLSIKGESFERSERILNTLMDIFNKDGITDRQLVSQRTIDFIDERFVDLAQDLDSIEFDRQEFKRSNNLIDLVGDAELGLQQKSQSEEEVFRLSNQLALAELIEEAIINTNNDLLPSNLGLESGNINTLIEDFNTILLDKNRLIRSGGANNPNVKLAQNQLESIRRNIKKSVTAYINQLRMSLSQLEKRSRRFTGNISELPKKEKLLRDIERQQKIKESLYLLLLQKKEEASINLAITEPSIKIVEYALSGSQPVSPNTKFVYAGAILLGLLVPFGILYVIFMLDTKLHGKDDITAVTTTVPVIAEIPDLKKKENLVFLDPNDRSVLAESFRILSSNVDYILPVKDNEKSKVIYCTSTIKGEGKTLVSLNLSLALSSINKKVLLIGADLRNPQIHSYISEDKHKPGLSNYLHDLDFNWKDAIISGFEKHPNHHIILSGSIPPNPAHLLTNGRFKALIEEAKSEYNYIIVDTAPTILVTDTMLISQLADATIYIARANYTEKNLLNYSKELSESGRIKNMAYVINSVGASKSYGYGYNYGYNYGYGSKT